jgi:hypothetical protein
MSFDADFDYSTAVTAIAADLVTVQAQKDVVDAEIACSTGATGYASLLGPETTALTAQQTRLAQQLVDLAAADAAITATNALVAGNKTDLYAFYGLSGESKSDFMIKLMFNHTAMLADADLIALLADGVNDQPTKEMVGKLIAAKFSPNASSITLHVLYRTLSRLA